MRDHRLNPAWPVAALALLLYLLTLSRHFTADSLLYALAIESNDWRALVDPTHLLLAPIGWAWYQLWRLAGWSGGSLIPLQVLNAIGGALCVGLVLAMARRLAGSSIIAVLAAAGFAVSGGLWLLSVEAEFVTLPAAAMLIVLWILLNSFGSEGVGGGVRSAIGAGLAVSIAILGYLTNLFLVVIVTVRILWLAPRLEKRGRWLLVFMGTMIFVLAPIAAAVIGQWSEDSWARLGWRPGNSIYGRIAWLNLPQGIYAFLRSLFLYPELAMNESTLDFLQRTSPLERALFGGYYLLGLSVALLPLLLGVLWRAQLVRTFKGQLIVLAFWTMLYGAFAFYWVPGDISFWLPLLAAWWIFLTMLTAVARTSGEVDDGLGPVPANRTFRISMAWVGGLVLTLGLVNSLLLILPRHEITTNQPYHIARQLAAETTPMDLILTDDDPVLEVYAAYFGRRQVISLPVREGSPEDPIDWAETFASVQASGGRVYQIRDGQPRVLEWPGS